MYAAGAVGALKKDAANPEMNQFPRRCSPVLRLRPYSDFTCAATATGGPRQPSLPLRDWLDVCKRRDVRKLKSPLKEVSVSGVYEEGVGGDQGPGKSHQNKETDDNHTDIGSRGRSQRSPRRQTEHSYLGGDGVERTSAILTLRDREDKLLQPATLLEKYSGSTGAWEHKPKPE
ncbi:hypothetical protein NDU88_000344 [Pleurodeles waltl]|uniref:Uncharacterized protein n=1 Tax=Pleurodeles waltl TaxID=8319 RepID=A0AAV7P3V7_PLEWA|nr:hypothetical protein NDU88_000344 [Pleurodeles waltl]